MAFSYNKKNLANTTISGSLSASATSVTVNDASVFPLGYFYATLMPSYEISEFGNSEIVLVTNITGDVLTIARAQNGTTARAFNDGSIITNGIYTQDMDMAQAVGKKIFNASWDSEAGYYKINDPMLKIVPDEGTSIRAVFDTDVPSGTYAALSVNENTEGGTATKIGKNIEISDANALAPVSVGLNGDTEQTTYSGKNLLLPSPRAQGSNGITASYNASTGTITLSGVANNNWSNAFNDVPVNLPAGTYTFSATTEAGLGRNIIFYNGSTNIFQKQLSDTETSFECVVPQAITSLRLWLTPANGTNYTGKTFKAQLEAGNQASSFEPYVGGIASPNPDYPQTIHTVSGEQTITISDGNSQSQEYEINLGKNLFNPSSASLSTTATFSGTAGNSFTTSANTYRDFVIIPVRPNTTYSISTSGSSYSAYTQYYIGGLSSLTTESGQSWGWITGSGTITTGSDTRFIGIIIRPRNSSGDISPQTLQLLNDIQFQLEEGSSATSYAAYFTPIELCKIGNYQDYIYKSGGDWYIHKATNRLNLKDYSGLAWWKSGSSIKITWEYMTIPAAVVPSSMNNAGETYCDHFTNGPAQEVWNGTRLVGYGLGPDGFYFNNNYSTANDFKTYIGNTPVYVYYALATPTDTQITNSALITQLEALASATLYEGQNNITVSGYLAGYLNLTYNTINSGVYVVNIVNGAYILDNNTRNPAPVKAGLPYDLTYYNGNWYIMNMIGEV